MAPAAPHALDFDDLVLYSRAMLLSHLVLTLFASQTLAVY